MLLVLGALAMPDVEGVARLAATVEHDGGSWLLAAVACFFASIGLTMGLPAVLWLFPGRGQVLCLVGVWIWAVGSIGTAGLAALLLLFRATARAVVLTPVAVEEIAGDRALVAGTTAVVAAFLVGELVVTAALLRTRAVPRWVPLVLLLHVALAPLAPTLPADLRGLQTVLLGVGLMGVAVTATESWALSRTRSSLV